jgi:methionyl aminopeptidase
VVVEAAIKPGASTVDLNDVAVREIAKHRVESAFLGYLGYPAHVCVSVNEEIVHGIPGERVLQEGDIVSIDLGATYQGFVGDSALTVGVGQIRPEAQRLLDVTYRSLWEGIRAAQAGALLGEVSHAIQTYAESHGYSVVREYVGHGVGREMHEDPQVPNFGEPGTGTPLKAGMVLAIEPMVTMGSWEVRVLPDRWTAVTQDGRWAAHFEDTIAIIENGPDVLTRFEQAV